MKRFSDDLFINKHSNISTNNIHIEKDSDSTQTQTQTQTQTAYTATRTETAQANTGRLKNLFDREKIETAVRQQREVGQEFGKTVAQAKTEIGKQLDQLKAQKERGTISQAEYDRRAGNLQHLSTGISMISAGLSAPTESATGIAAATVSPAVSYGIGQYFKNNAEQNKQDGGNRPEEGSAAHLSAHFLNGLLTGSVSGGNGIAAGLSAASSELAAPVLSKTLYGKATGKLNAEEKQTITELTGLIGAGIGAVGGDAQSAVSGSRAARSAVENNFLISQTVHAKGWLNREESAVLERIARKAKAQTVEYYAEEYRRIQQSSLSTEEKGKLSQQLFKNYEADSKRMESAAASLPVGSRDRSLFISAAGKMSNLIGLVPPYEKSPFIRSEQRDWSSVPLPGAKVSGYSKVWQDWDRQAGYTEAESSVLQNALQGGRTGLGFGRGQLATGIRQAAKAQQQPIVRSSHKQAENPTLGSVGSVKGVNPTGSHQNCTNCVYVVDNLLKTGNKASALPRSVPVPFNQLELLYGTKLSGWVSKSQIENSLLSKGNGTRAVIYGTDGVTGHVWNAVVQKGKVNYIDGQIQKGGEINFSTFNHFQFGVLP